MRITKSEALWSGRCKTCCAYQGKRQRRCTAEPREGIYCPRENPGKVDFGEAVAPKSGAQRRGSAAGMTPKVEDRTCSLKLVSIFRG